MTDSFRHHTRLEVRFRDIDAFGHVNNASFVTYLEQARVRFLIDTLEVDVVQSLPLILAALKVDFRSPIHFGQEVGIGGNELDDFLVNIPNSSRTMQIGTRVTW